MHLTVALLRLGYRVGTVDLDARQWTLTRYLSNRAATVQGERMALPMPRHFFLAPSDKVNRAEAQDEDRTRFEAILGKLKAEVDYVVLDCAGTDSFLARTAPSFADPLVPPAHDTFVDLHVVAPFPCRPPPILPPPP